MSYPNNCHNDGRHSALSSPDLSPIGDQNMSEMEYNDDHLMVEMNEDNDNTIKYDNRSLLTTNGDINDNNDSIEDNLLLDQMEAQSDSEVGSNDMTQQIDVELKNGLNNQSISDNMVLRNDIKTDYTEVFNRFSNFYENNIFLSQRPTKR